MIPGPVSKVTEAVVASAATIVAKSDLLLISGSTQINTILCPLFLGRGGVAIYVVPTDGNVVLGTSGNILVGQTLVQNRLYMLIYSAKLNKWYIHGVV